FGVPVAYAYKVNPQAFYVEVAQQAQRLQKSSGVKPFVQITQGLKPYMGQQVSSFQGRFAEWRLRRLGAT
ncbi:MAG: hypothetical protein KA148_06545, partial [Ottowia sp.]|nr:hypothetical protein [Ottowia sp.]